MAKYGLFRTSGGQPLQVYEGDYMKQDKQIVRIMKHGDPHEVEQLVAVIHLDKGESVKKITE